MRRLTNSLCAAAAAACLAGGSALAADQFDPKSPDAGGAPPHERDAVMTDPAADPKAEDPTPKAEDRFQRDEAMGADTATTSTPGTEYVVEAGDTLAGIAREKLGSADQWKVIAQANGIDDPARLQVGQKLKIPDGDRS